MQTRDLQRTFLEDDAQPAVDISPAALAQGDAAPTFVFTVPQRPEQPSDAREASSSPEPDLDEVEGAASLAVEPVTRSAKHPVKAKAALKKSRHGIPFPSLPLGVVKKMASTFAASGGKSKSKLGKDTMAALMQASDWFLEQVSDDLGSFARHAGRKTIDESDMITLMKRCACSWVEAEFER